LPATPPAVVTVSHITVNITGTGVGNSAGSANMETLLFSSCSPPNWSIEAPKHIFHGKDGTPQSIIGSVQNPTYGTMTLTQGWDPNHVLASWMNYIAKPENKIEDKKATITVTFMDSTGQTALFQWIGTGALLTGFTHAASDASSNGVLTISATIDADTWTLAGPTGTDPI
jgi:hypothetical protein